MDLRKYLFKEKPFRGISTGLSNTLRSLKDFIKDEDLDNNELLEQNHLSRMSFGNAGYPELENIKKIVIYDPVKEDNSPAFSVQCRIRFSGSPNFFEYSVDKETRPVSVRYLGENEIILVYEIKENSEKEQDEAFNYFIRTYREINKNLSEVIEAAKAHDSLVKIEFNKVIAYLKEQKSKLTGIEGFSEGLRNKLKNLEI
jgi:hypothetical protein